MTVSTEITQQRPYVSPRDRKGRNTTPLKRTSDVSSTGHGDGGGGGGGGGGVGGDRDRERLRSMIPVEKERRQGLTAVGRVASRVRTSFSKARDPNLETNHLQDIDASPWGVGKPSTTNTTTTTTTTTTSTTTTTTMSPPTEQINIKENNSSNNTSPLSFSSCAILINDNIPLSTTTTPTNASDGTIVGKESRTTSATTNTTATTMSPNCSSNVIGYDDIISSNNIIVIGSGCEEDRPRSEHQFRRFNKVNNKPAHTRSTSSGGEIKQFSNEQQQRPMARMSLDNAILTMMAIKPTSPKSAKAGNVGIPFRKASSRGVLFNNLNHRKTNNIENETTETLIDERCEFGIKENDCLSPMDTTFNLSTHTPHSGEKSLFRSLLAKSRGNSKGSSSASTNTNTSALNFKMFGLNPIVGKSSSSSSVYQNNRKYGTNNKDKSHNTNNSMNDELCLNSSYDGNNSGVSSRSAYNINNRNGSRLNLRSGKLFNGWMNLLSGNNTHNNEFNNGYSNIIGRNTKKQNGSCRTPNNKSMNKVEIINGNIKVHEHYNNTNKENIINRKNMIRVGGGSNSKKKEKEKDRKKKDVSELDFVDDEFYDSDEDEELGNEAIVVPSLARDDFVAYQTGQKQRGKEKNRPRVSMMWM